MTISLSKGQRVSLSKDQSLTKIRLGLGWEPRKTDGAEFDLDVSIFMLGENGKVVNDKFFIFYGELESPEGAVRHSGDNRSGDGAGDDETVFVNLPLVDPRVNKLVVAVTIHDAAKRRQNFGQVDAPYICLYNDETGEAVFKYDLAEDYSVETAMIFGEIYRHNGDWKFGAVGQGYSEGLLALCRQYGVDASE